MNRLTSILQTIYQACKREFLSVPQFSYSLGYLLTIHVAALLFFSIFRFILFLSTEYEFPADIQDDILLQATAFLRGLWFDNVIACYILALPLLILWLAALANIRSKGIFLGVSGIFMAFYSLAFAVTAANIPYFDYFFKTINSSIYNWFGYVATTAGMVVGESSYYFPIAFGLVAIVLVIYGIGRLTNFFYTQIRENHPPLHAQQRIGIFVGGLLCAGLCLFGIRGRTGYNPIRISQAYYCTDPFLNQIGINPVFNLLMTTLDDNRKENKQLQVMPDAKAIAYQQMILQRKGIEGISPLAREVKHEGTPTRQNVVLIFMESMSANLMNHFGSQKNLTPFLDSLFQQSIAFERFYSAGIHTNHGVYSTLYSFPSVLLRNAMKGSSVPIYSGLPTILKENGYQNLFFMTHESQYDNMNAFLRTNGFDEIYAQENYPPEKVVNNFGVQDDFLYQYALPVLNERAASGQPFFSVLLSITNHPPYIVPDYFQPRSSELEDQIIEYADWAIQGFMQEVAKQPWFDNTLFVLLGDHGKRVRTPDCELPQSYNHIPLMIYGKHLKPRIQREIAGQVDVAPTLLGLLNISYTQNNFGMDVLKENRPYVYFSDDELIAASDSSHLYIYSPSTQQTFTYRREGFTLHRTEAIDSLFQPLKEFCLSTLQATEYLVGKRMTVNHPQP